MLRTLPIVHCFDHGYVLPAGVCFQSMLEHARTPGIQYALKVIGTGLTEEDQALLLKIVARFPQATLTFLSPGEQPVSAFPILKNTHFSSDLFFKLQIPDLFPDDEIVLVADVDVCYQDDVASVLEVLPPAETWSICGVDDTGYAAAHGRGLFPTGRPLVKKYARTYSPDEIRRLEIGAGFMVYNCKRLHQERCVEKWFEFAKRNAHRLILPEQEILNLSGCVLKGRLPLRFMAIAGFAETYDQMDSEARKKNPAWDEMFAHPVQMHYASRIKPWKFPGSPRAELWFDACVRAGLIENWRQWYGDYSRSQVEWELAKSVLSCRMNLGRRWFGVRVVKGKAGK